ncbi:hydrogen gas-evolving membrane-bound hydrogenase subunit E [Natranaerobius trueperi]|uniref:MrpA C-terminal/MbhE domain-containing protein n=1 Tax=Natranaerobius trueperi TaxID=759412 RepID=A0A226C0K6_9FIRM|nr:hydrogen gas-evolving membrane-bound hydrogenase subunit E [Natranaerobius trueperi]OWZ83907.1 hypothetical protein CDO51_05840 [Natranaerobius trueperi]
MIKQIVTIVLLLVIGYSMFAVVTELPTFGEPDNPAFNEVTERYLEKGPEETENLNIVSAILVEYRAFDTFGEITVLFASITGVLAIMEGSKKE